MKKLLLAALLLSPLPAIAQSDYFVEWTIYKGLTDDLVRLEADIKIGRKYIAVNGSFFNSENATAPATGTCVELTESRIHCRITALSVDYTINASSDLSGSITQYNIDGSILRTALITLKTLE